MNGRDKEETEVLLKPLHKKNPDIGEKQMIFSSRLLMEQEDAASFGDNEEVSLLDLLALAFTLARSR